MDLRNVGDWHDTSTMPFGLDHSSVLGYGSHDLGHHVGFPKEPHYGEIVAQNTKTGFIRKILRAKTRYIIPNHGRWSGSDPCHDEDPVLE